MKNQDIIAAADKRLGEAVDADRENREAALDDMEKIAGRQWDKDTLSEREAEGRPCPTHNRLAGFVRQVTGDIRRLNPAIRVIPSDQAASEDTAEVIAGTIRQIEYKSEASSAYEQATENAAQCGMGAFRILTEYENEGSFDQVIRIKHIPNPFSVYWDPAAKMSTREDAEFCFITEQMKKEAFQEQYPGKTAENVSNDGNTDNRVHWGTGGDVVVAEYFWREPGEKTIGLLSNGDIVEDPQAIHDVRKTRKVQTSTVMWAKISGAEVLEGPQEMPCKHLPVVAVMGEEIAVGDEVVRTSVIRFAKDSQAAYNWASAAMLETISLQPKAPYLVTAKQIAGLEGIWNQANESNRPYLPYNPDEKAPAPQRIPPPIPSAGLTNEIMKAAEDMKATTGIFDAGLGQRSNEQSGVAIRQRQMESDVSTSIYTDNLAKAIGHTGRILVDMIPKVYDTARMMRIIGEDDQEQTVPINAYQATPGKLGQVNYQKVNHLSEGTYDVRVTVGPNYSTRRQESAESMMQFVQAFPQAATVAGDLIAKSMDWEGADKIADRLKKTLPPGLISEEEMEPEQVQQMRTQIQAQQQSQAQQEKITMAMAQADIRSKQARATEDEADATKAQAEAAQTQVETAMMTGQLDAAMQQAVQQQVLLTLQQMGIARI